MEKKEKKKNPIINLLKTEWKFLGDRKPIFIVYMFLFFNQVNGIFPTMKFRINSFDLCQ